MKKSYSSPIITSEPIQVGVFGSYGGCEGAWVGGWWRRRRRWFHWWG